MAANVVRCTALVVGCKDTVISLFIASRSYIRGPTTFVED